MTGVAATTALKQGLPMHFRWKRWISLATPLLALAALAIVVHALEQLTFARVVASLERIGTRHFIAALLCTAASYTTLTSFDWLGARHGGSRLGYPRIALASFLSLSIGHTVGFSPFSSGAVRYRYYSKWGLSTQQIGLIILFSAVTVALGETTLSAIILLAKPSTAQHVLGLNRIIILLIGSLCTMLVLGYLACAVGLRRRIDIFGWRFEFPNARLALAQIAMGLLDYIFVTAALHSLLSASTQVDFFTTAAAYILGSIAALLTHVPGGLGVLEGTIALLLPNTEAIGPLIAFRCIYFLLPLTAGLTLLGVTELRGRIARRRAQRSRDTRP
jgi:uncharacterized membrane protein YbhN (UPF0104 family)